MIQVQDKKLDVRLIEAAGRGDLLLVKALIKAGANPKNGSGVKAESALSRAIESGSEKVALELIALTDMKVEEPFAASIWNKVVILDQLKLAKALIAFGLPLQTQKRLNQEDGIRPPLIEALLRGQVAMVKVLAPHSDMNEELSPGKDALVLAIEHANKQASYLMVDALIPFCNPLKHGLKGNTPLMVALKKGRTRNIKLLLEISDVAAMNDKGQTALDILRSAKNLNPAEASQMLHRMMALKEAKVLTTVMESVGAVEPKFSMPSKVRLAL